MKIEIDTQCEKPTVNFKRHKISFLIQCQSKKDAEEFTLKLIDHIEGIE